MERNGIYCKTIREQNNFLKVVVRAIRNKMRKEIKQALAEEGGVEMEVEIIANGCCYVCDKLDGRKLTLQEAVNDFPIPIRGCKRVAGCNCCTALIAKRDSNGNLIWK